MSPKDTTMVRYLIRIGDIARLVEQTDHDIAAAIAEAFEQMRRQGVDWHTDHRGGLTVTVERVR